MQTITPQIETIHTPVQTITLEQEGKRMRLFIGDFLQVDTLDEHLYHEALVDFGLENIPNTPQKVLVLGGGDGLVARNLLRFPQIESIFLIDFDATIVSLFRQNPKLLCLNENALNSPKVTIKIADAFEEIQTIQETFDIIIADFPDPDYEETGKLYTKEFYEHVKKILHPEWRMVCNVPEIVTKQKAFQTVIKTLQSVFQNILPYSQYIPSFLDLGFVICSQKTLFTPILESKRIEDISLETTHIATIKNNLIYHLHQLVDDR